MSHKSEWRERGGCSSVNGPASSGAVELVSILSISIEGARESSTIEAG